MPERAPHYAEDAQEGAMLHGSGVLGGAAAPDGRGRARRSASVVRNNGTYRVFCGTIAKLYVIAAMHGAPSCKATVEGDYEAFQPGLSELIEEAEENIAACEPS